MAMTKKITWGGIGIIIGVIGGLISIPKGLVEAYQTIFKKPKLVIERSAPVSIMYDPRRKIITFSCGLILENKGNDSEAIEKCAAYFGVPGDIPGRAVFDDSEVTFKDSGNTLAKVVVIPKDGGIVRIQTCEITSEVTKEVLTLFNQHETKRELVIQLFGRADKLYTSDPFHFDFGPDVVAKLSDPKLQETQSIGPVTGSNLE
jgi:hypothetical protein